LPYLGHQYPNVLMFIRNPRGCAPLFRVERTPWVRRWFSREPGGPQRAGSCQCANLEGWHLPMRPGPPESHFLLHFRAVANCETEDSRWSRRWGLQVKVRAAACSAAQGHARHSLLYAPSVEGGDSPMRACSEMQ